MTSPSASPLPSRSPFSFSRRRCGPRIQAPSSRANLRAPDAYLTRHDWLAGAACRERPSRFPKDYSTSAGRPVSEHVRERLRWAVTEPFTSRDPARRSRAPAEDTGRGLLISDWFPAGHPPSSRRHRARVRLCRPTRSGGPRRHAPDALRTELLRAGPHESHGGRVCRRRRRRGHGGRVRGCPTSRGWSTPQRPRAWACSLHGSTRQPAHVGPLRGGDRGPCTDSIRGIRSSTSASEARTGTAAPARRVQPPAPTGHPVGCPRSLGTCSPSSSRTGSSSPRAKTGPTSASGGSSVFVLPLDPSRTESGEQYVPLPEGLLTTVILGSRVETGDRDRVLELVSSDELLRGVEVLQGSISDEEFRIDLEARERTETLGGPPPINTTTTSHLTNSPALKDCILRL